MLVTLVYVWAVLATLAWVFTHVRKTRYSCQQTQTLILEMRNGSLEFVNHVGCAEHFISVIIVCDDWECPDQAAANGYNIYRIGDAWYAYKTKEVIKAEKDLYSLAHKASLREP